MITVFFNEDPAAISRTSTQCIWIAKDDPSFIVRVDRVPTGAMGLPKDIDFTPLGSGRLTNFLKNYTRYEYKPPKRMYTRSVP